MTYTDDDLFDPMAVRLVPCDLFRIPLSGDLFACADCGWWPSEHENDSERWV